MKILIVLYAIASATLALDKFNCDVPVVDIDKKWITMTQDCVKQTRNQIQKEMTVTMQYLVMAAHFSQDSINRPGFASLFFEGAIEERDHSIKLVEYLLMRGELASNVSTLLEVPIPNTITWNSGLSALKDALLLETQLTYLNRKLIDSCQYKIEALNNYHFVDYLTTVYLEKQHKRQRFLAGMISTLGKMQMNHGNLGEFMFDQNLLD